MSLRCPCCQSEEFYVVVEHTYSFKVKEIGLEDVTPGHIHDSIAGKVLVCDECNFNGWIPEYHYAKSGMLPLNLNPKEENEDE